MGESGMVFGLTRPRTSNAIDILMPFGVAAVYRVIVGEVVVSTIVRLLLFAERSDLFRSILISTTAWWGHLCGSRLLNGAACCHDRCHGLLCRGPPGWSPPQAMSVGWTCDRKSRWTDPHPALLAMTNCPPLLQILDPPFAKS